jgi:hypothetical protein
LALSVARNAKIPYHYKGLTPITELPIAIDALDYLGIRDTNVG